MVSGRGNNRDQSGRLREATFDTKKLIRVDIALDELPRTGSERRGSLFSAVQNVANVANGPYRPHGKSRLRSQSG
jgi:hypothetical protein